MFFFRLRGVFVRVESVTAGANRVATEVAEEEQHRHDPTGGERALQRHGPFGGSLTGRPGNVRSLREQRLVRTAAALEVRQWNVAEIPRISLACPPVRSRLIGNRLDP